MSDLDARKAAFASSFGLTLEQYQKLASRCTTDELVTCLELLKAKHHRSGYRARLAQTIRTWFDGADPSHFKPLSYWQFKNAAPKWPVHYNFPT